MIVYYGRAVCSVGVLVFWGRADGLDVGTTNMMIDERAPDALARACVPPCSLRPTNLLHYARTNAVARRDNTHAN
jgi:hypothetical protein